MSGEELAPTFANTGELTHHDLGCRCWPHVSEQDALDAIAAVGLAEYRDGRAALAAPSTPEPSGDRKALLARLSRTYIDGKVTLDAAAFDDLYEAWLRAAPSTEPALDVERLAQALHDQKMDWDDGDSHAIGTLVYDQDGDTHTEWGNCTGPDGHRSVAYDLVDRAARLAESQP